MKIKKLTEEQKILFTKRAVQWAKENYNVQVALEALFFSQEHGLITKEQFKKANKEERVKMIRNSMVDLGYHKVAPQLIAEGLIEEEKEESDVPAKRKIHAKKYNIDHLTPEQIEDLMSVVEAGAKYGYHILDSVDSKEEWQQQIIDVIGEQLKDATGYSDEDVAGVVEDMWNASFPVNGQEKTIKEWAEDKGIDINDKNNKEEKNKDIVTGVWTLGNNGTPDVELSLVMTPQAKKTLALWGVIEAIEEQVNGGTFRESIEEDQKDVNLRSQGAVENLEWQLERLNSAVENGVVDYEVIEGEYPMTEEELQSVERQILHPEPPAIWDETPC